MRAINRLKETAYNYPEYGMASISPKYSGLHLYVMARPKPDDKHKQPSIKVRLIDGVFKNKEGTLVVSVEDEPKVIEGDVKVPAKKWKELVTWIVLNKKPLIKYWSNDKYLTTDFLLDLKNL